MNTITRCSLAIGAVVLIVACQDRNATTDYPDIGYDDLVAAIRSKTVTLLDANGSESYARDHIPGAIDFQAAKQNGSLAAKLPRDKTALVVAYCGGARCKAYQAAADAAKDLGYTNVKHFSAGISGWKARTEQAGKCPCCDKPTCHGGCMDKEKTSAAPTGGEGVACSTCTAPPSACASCTARKDAKAAACPTCGKEGCTSCPAPKKE